MGLKHLDKRWRALWNHDMYHGWAKTKNYFEGWYVKLVTADQSHAIAFIPGISKGDNGESHCFIQVMDGTNAQSEYIEFDAKEFFPAEDKFSTKIADNHFSANGIQLDLPNHKGSIEYEGLTPWPTKFMAPGIMGWYSFVPFMQCYHGVVSVHHRLTGQLTINGVETDFTNGIGYIEKDWGTSFPKAWVWMQSNHFTGKEAPQCLMVSIAHIPWLGNHFIGFLAGLLWKGEILVFTTYNGAKQTVSIKGQQAFIQIKRKEYLLDIVAKKKKGAELISPIQGAMTGKLEESLESELDVKFYISDKLVYEGTGTSSGLEMGGEVDALVT